MVKHQGFWLADPFFAEIVNFKEQRKRNAPMIQTVGLALAFSPTAEQMLAEAIRITTLFRARMVLIHIGEHGLKEEETLNTWLQKSGLADHQVTLRWEKGDPAKVILRICHEERVSLLLAGALKKENLLHYYMGTIARHIMRKAPCSVLLLMQPSLQPKGFKNIVVNAEDSPYVEESVAMAFEMGTKEDQAWVHVVRELKLYGLAMSASDQCSEEEYEGIRQGLVKEEIGKVEQLIRQLPHDHLKVNIKVISGKSGFELSQFAKKKQADLLVVGAPARRFAFFDRVFTHDLEYVFADLPCNLLIVHPGKEGKHV